MIYGVQLKSLIKHQDDRGYFMEILRSDDSFFHGFGQASQSMTFPGVIKAFHYHLKQDDIWYFPKGHAQVVLHDLRMDSMTHGQTDVLYMSEDLPLLLFIPRGVAHGYRVLGMEPAVIFYFTNQPYDADDPDEYRLPYDDPRIGFSWETKYR